MGRKASAALPAVSQMETDARNIPPSTISALVQHQSRAPSAGFDIFVVQYVQDIRADPGANIRDDVEENCALIYSLVHTVHLALANNTTLELPEDFVDHALACLDVIGLSIRKTPNVLFHHIDDQRVGRSLLCLWMCPKVFATATMVHENRLQHGLVRLLEVSLSALSDHFRYRKQHQRLLSFYKLCTEELATAASKAGEFRSLLDDIDITLPSAEARETITGSTQNPVVLAIDCQVRVRSLRNASKIELVLLQAIIASAPFARPKRVLAGTDMASVAWLVDTLGRVWNTAASRLLQRDGDHTEQLLISFLNTLSRATRLALFSESLQSFVPRIGGLLTACITRCLPIGSSSMSNHLQITLIEALATLGQSIRRDSCLRQVVRRRLLPSLIEAMSKPEVLSAEATDAVLNTLSLIDAGLSRQTQAGGIAVEGQVDNEGMTDETPRAVKRPRKDPPTPSEEQSDYKSQREGVKDLCSLLGDWDQNNLSGLDRAIPGLFSDLSDDQQTDVLVILKDLMTAQPGSSSCGASREGVTRNASHDKARGTKSSQSSAWSEKEWDAFFSILCALIGSSSVQHSKTHRIVMATTINALVSFTPKDSHRDLNTSALGKWCLQNLRSSIRQLRVAAATSLSAFLEERNGDALAHQNRIIVLEVLKQLSDLDDTRLCETVILAFGQVARVCEGDERAIALNQLVEYLGHTSKLVCDMAHIELKELANTFSHGKVDELLRPYWRVVGVTVVKDLLTRPQKPQQLADLSELRVDQLFALMQAEVLPWLVLEKRQDILHKLAQLRNRDGSIWDLCMHRRNLPAILALIVVQHPEDLEAAVTSYLCHASTEFRGEDAATLLRADPISLACEVLRLAGDKDDIDQEKARHGFLELAVLIERKGQQAKAASTQARMSALFFENHALGIMNAFSSVIDSEQELVSNKKRCVQAIHQMIIAGQANIVVALPQIRASLQSAMEIISLRNPAFCAWTALVNSLDQTEDLQGVIGQTFAVIVQNWNFFSPETQKTAYDTVVALIKNHSELVQSMIVSIPSLGAISLLSKFETQLAKFRDKVNVSIRLQAFGQRCRDENSTVVLQALRELSPYLEANQQWLHESAVTEQPNPIIPSLVRSLLDICARYNEHNGEILELAVSCLGIVGCLDPNRVETIAEKTQKVVLSNFQHLTEAVDFVAFLLEIVLVKAFNSASNPRMQGFLAYVMQELLKFCGFNKEASSVFRPYGSQGDEVHQRWLQMSDQTRATLTPFLTSRYVLATQLTTSNNLRAYPLFSPALNHGAWLTDFVQDLLHRANGDNAKQIFGVLSRVVRINDTSIATFILPFVVANIIVGGTKKEVADVGQELLTVLQCDIAQQDLRPNSENVKMSSESVFQVLDYLTRFLQEKKKALATAQTVAARSARPMPEAEEQTFVQQITDVDKVLKMIPAQIISRRAVECGSYARALFHWEQHMRHVRKESIKPHATPFDQEQAFQRLQDIYSQIDEPDGIEGISAYLHALKPEQQVLEHRRAGRWSAVQSWYELKLKQQPQNLDLHIELLDCLKHAGQHQLVLDHAHSLGTAQRENSRFLSVVSEAAWSSGNLHELGSILTNSDSSLLSDFNTGVGTAILALQRSETTAFSETIRAMRMSIAKSMSRSATSSLQACHDQMLQLHALYELQALSGNTALPQAQQRVMATLMNQRLHVLGSYIPEKQYLLSLRRAIMGLSNIKFSDQDMASSWLTSARLARKENWSNVAYDAVLQAAQLGDESAKVEQARLLWKAGEHRKAIKSLETAIELNSFSGRSAGTTSTSTSFSTVTAATSDGKQVEQNLVVAKAHLLLAKWLDTAGQTQSSLINQRYQLAARSFTRWEKGLYHLGRFYNKLLESEKALPLSKQNHSFLSGETAKLVIENFLRSLMFGCKYVFESVPKLLTLWLDFGNEIGRSLSKEISEDMRVTAADLRPRMLDTINKQIKKYSEKLPAYLFYTALAQMVTRMGHSNKHVYELLATIIIKVVAAHPQQGLWPLLAVVKSTSLNRAKRAEEILRKLADKGKSIRNAGQDVDLRNLVSQGERMSAQLLHACETELEGRTAIMSLTRDMGFNPKVAPCALVVPVEQTLSASLPTTTVDHAQVKSHRAFPMSREAVTISSFQDDVLVLNSLQRPRKLTVRGSDGRKYSLLCKPKDDLRKDQRLMEFNAMINRALKKDAESSKRRLYIKTYAVTPLNETCGLIEWVDGLKPMRDILITSYRSQGIKVDYNLLKEMLNEACLKPENSTIFTQQILPMYEPVLHEWFTECFSDPESWFTARLRYTRSAAVSSMQGYALGLGDRHGENVLLEENSGGVFHVDFNCLFEKGLTFDKPELVPFRLTHNMVDACGAYGVEGPFRRSAECAMRVMRAGEDALLTIMETFVYDPTTDFVGPRKRPVKGVPETPKEVLDSVRSKLRGLMRGESVPLSVGGHVDALIKQATDPRHLCAMYIGWCAFL